MTDRRPLPEHRRPAGVTDATVEALGKLSEALEAVEHARGHLYGFHRLSRHRRPHARRGRRRSCARPATPSSPTASTRELLGRNVIHGRWTFQVVEEYDDTYYATFKELEKLARDELVGGRRHLFEAEMKESRRYHGDPDHSRHAGRHGISGSRKPVLKAARPRLG